MARDESETNSLCDPKQLEWANFVVLMTNQALVGAITPNMVAVLVELKFEESVTVHFILRDDTPIDRAEIQEVLLYLDSHLSHTATRSIDSRVTISREFVPPPSFTERTPDQALTDRLVFLRRHPSPDENLKGLPCARCGRQVIANAEWYETLESMHWTCFHYEFEHRLDDGTDDLDQACADPCCPARAFDPNPPPTWETWTT